MPWRKPLCASRRGERRLARRVSGSACQIASSRAESTRAASPARPSAFALEAGGGFKIDSNFAIPRQREHRPAGGVRKVEAQGAAAQKAAAMAGLPCASVFENQRRGGLVQGGAEQATEKTAGGNVMPPVVLEMKSRGAGVFGGIEQLHLILQVPRVKAPRDARSRSGHRSRDCRLIAREAKTRSSIAAKIHDPMLRRWRRLSSSVSTSEFAGSRGASCVADRMRVRRNALQAALDCLGQRIDVRGDAFQMAAHQRVHRDLRRELLPFRHIPAAAHDVVGEEQGDRPVIRPRTVTGGGPEERRRHVVFAPPGDI